MAGPALASGDTRAPNKTTIPGLPYRSYILVLLTLCAALSTLDRLILTMLLEPIRKDLGLSDTQLGLLTGIAFALVYTFGAIPLARLADRTSRRLVISACVTFWSMMTIACGAATNFVQLFLARMGVGLGESGNLAPGQALLADIFPAKQRGTVMALYMVGPPVGIAAGLTLGGWAVTHFDWRAAFLFAGLPGLILGPLVFLTVRNIGKGLADGVSNPDEHRPLPETLRTLWSIKSLVLLIGAGSLTTLIGMGLSAWFPTFLVRSHGLAEVEIGAALGSAMGLGSFLGHLVGGPVGDWLGARSPRWQVLLGIFTTTTASLAALAAFLAPSSLVYLLMGLQVFCTGIFTAPMIAMVATLAPVWARATAAACFMFMVNLIGLGVGPALVGSLSDLLAPIYGDNSLRMAMIFSLLIALPAAVLYYLASLHYPKDLKAAEERLAAATGEGAVT